VPHFLLSYLPWNTLQCLHWQMHAWMQGAEISKNVGFAWSFTCCKLTASLAMYFQYYIYHVHWPQSSSQVGHLHVGRKCLWVDMIYIILKIHCQTSCKFATSKAPCKTNIFRNFGILLWRYVYYRPQWW
jgi:hypothetical protein